MNVHVWLVYYDRADFFGSFTTCAEALAALNADYRMQAAEGAVLAPYGPSV